MVEADGLDDEVVEQSRLSCRLEMPQVERDGRSNGQAIESLFASLSIEQPLGDGPEPCVDRSALDANAISGAFRLEDAIALEAAAGTCLTGAQLGKSAQHDKHSDRGIQIGQRREIAIAGC